MTEMNINLENEENDNMSHISEDDEILELDQLITEGVNAKIPYTFLYPNTNKKVGVQIRPLSTTEFSSALTRAKKFKSNFLIELVKIGLYKMDGTPFPAEQLDKLPAGVITRLSSEISRISGLDLTGNPEEYQNGLIEDLMGF